MIGGTDGPIKSPVEPVGWSAGGPAASMVEDLPHWFPIRLTTTHGRGPGPEAKAEAMEKTKDSTRTRT